MKYYFRHTRKPYEAGIIFHACISQNPSRYSTGFSENMKQGEVGSLRSHDFLHLKKDEGSFKRRDPLTRDFVFCQKSNPQWGGSG